MERHREPRDLPDWTGIVNDTRPWSVEEQNQALFDGLDNVEGWSPDRSDVAEDVRHEREGSVAG